MATAFFGGATPWLAQWWVERSGWGAPGAMIALVAVLVLPVLWTLPDGRGAKRAVRP